MDLSKYTIWKDKKGYPTIWVDGKNIKVHVILWEEVNGSKPKGFDIHHKDFNKGNYDLDNLELLSQSDHQKLHAGWKKIDGVFCLKPCNGCNKVLSLDKFYPRKGLTPSAKCRGCSKRIWKETARKEGVKERRLLVPNNKGEYQCHDCMEWHTRDKHKFSNNKPMSYCKNCFNKRQTNLRRLRNG